MDELLPSPPKRRKQLLSPKPPASQRSRLTKKLKTGLTPHNSFSGDPKTINVPPKARPVQKNALAGPSTQASAAGVMTQSQSSSRISRPTAKKTTTRIHKRAVVSGSDSDSDQSFPSTVLPKAPINAKKRKLSGISRSSPSKEYKARQSKAQGKRKVVHLGAIELSSDSGDDYPIKPIKKRPKRNEGKSLSSDIIDLCSDLEESLSPLKTPTRTRMDNNVVVILSSDDEDHPSPNLFNSGMDVDNQGNHSPFETLPESQGKEDRGSELLTSQQDPEVPTSAASNEIPSSQNDETLFECLQLSLNEALKKAKPKSGDNGAGHKVPCFTPPTSARPPRMLIFPDNLPSPILHTPGFFSRAVAAAKTAVLAAQKRAKKRRFQALLLASSSTNHGTSRWTPVKLCEPEVSTLDISPSLATPEDTVDCCAEPRTAPATYPEYTVPVRTEMQEPSALTHFEGLTGGQAHESSIAYVRSGMEKYTANSMLEDSLKDASGDASPSVGQDAQDAQRDLADSVTLNSAGMASARPVLQSPSSDALSVDESNNEASLGGSGITLGESDYLPTASQFKASRSISEIPEETRSSAQCLVQVLNDFKTLKKFVNVTTPPAVVISPHVEGSKSIVDRSAISLSNSPTSDPSDTESPPPVTPPDSQTDEPHPIATKTVSILDFDLNNLNFPLFMGDSQCDDDDDDLSLSGLELVYPDDVC